MVSKVMIHPGVLSMAHVLECKTLECVIIRDACSARWRDGFTFQAIPAKRPLFAHVA